MDFSEERSELERKFYDLCLKVVNTVGIDLYDLEFVERSQLLRIFVIDPQSKSATLDDCVKVDRALTPHIEEEDWMPDTLTLEVSSPGIYRNLRSRQHFELSIGERVSIILFRKSEELGREVVGVLRVIEENSLLLESDNKGMLTIEIENIKKAKLMPKL
ncbi:MAG: hypothetical protein HN353_09305 [Bdellovibrionales bacterium]|jgi:ribosome maturation factor RimP|nr:hypothetical protein [Bdellovibrionales bacterium]MBT3527329.1 hypothetical protein [Bdellovibrionales bacterium]MBT7670234.1 hypothetical protein [Bdellovibrionales bacterium]MBT7766485.1 hypothetical protein [Bdellovibrionales bacterium]